MRTAIRGTARKQALVLVCCLQIGVAGAIPLDTGTLPARATQLPDANARYIDGLKALAANRLDDADRSFRACLEVASKASPCMLGVATVAWERGNRDESGAWIERAVAADPEDAFAQASLGRWRAINGRNAEAIAALEKAARLDPKAVRPRVDLGDIYLATKGDVDRAIEKYREALAIDETHGGAHYALAAALARKGDQAGAEKELRRAAALSPGNPLPALALAQLFQASGDMKEAEKYAREAVKIQPSLLPARVTLGQILESTSRYDDALEQYRALTTAYPTLAAPYFYTGALLHRRGDVTGATAEYNKALKNDPKFAPALNNLAMIELTQNRSATKAEALARRAVEAAPGTAMYQDTLSEVLEAKGDLKGALAAERQAVKLDPANPGYLARVGELQSRLGQKNEAVSSLTKALQMSASFPGAAEARKLLESLKR